MLLSEMFGVERDKPFMVDGISGEYKIGLFCEKYEKLLTIDSFGDWIPAKDGLLCVVIDRAPSGIIHLPPPLTDEQREQLRAIWTLGGRWLAKDESGEVFTFNCKPRKNSYLAIWLPPKCVENAMQFRTHYGLDVCSLVSWSDTEPYDIAKALGVGE